MIRPDIRTYHDDWGEYIAKGHWHRDHFLGRSPRSYYNRSKQAPANVRQDGALFHMDLALPGFSKDEIAVKVEDNVLTVTAQKTHQEITKSKYVVQEFDVDTIERKFQLANIASHENISASYEDGILKLTFENTCDVNHDLVKRIAVS